jgi:hypothetical protein
LHLRFARKTLARAAPPGYHKTNAQFHHVGVLLFGFEPDPLLLT